MTTYVNTYPSFRQFIVDAQTMLPIKIETYTLDILAEEPEFVLDHELTEYFSMPDLSPKSFDELAQKMLTDESLALNYQRAKSQGGPNAITQCDEECRLRASCEASQSTHIDVKVCQGEPPLSIVSDPVNSVAEHFMDPWYSYTVIPTPEKKSYLDFFLQ